MFILAARSAGMRPPTVTTHRLARPLQFAGVSATTYYVANGCGTAAAPITVQRSGAGYVSPAEIMVESGAAVVVRCEENIVCDFAARAGVIVVTMRDMGCGISGW